MKDEALTIEVFLCKHDGAWRLYVSRASWCPPELQAKLDDHLEAVLVEEPNLDELKRRMWANDCPYKRRDVKLGGYDLSATGRSAIALAAWLVDLRGA